jgi:hypothetical protein
MTIGRTGKRDGNMGKRERERVREYGEERESKEPKL